jgi:pimeloyl-ACP methyl ester carboxylesterase
MAKYVVTDYLAYGPVATYNLIRSMLAYPTTERIAELTLPVLVVLGDRDPFVSERWVKRRAAGLPHVTGVTIHGAAHAINFSHPEQLANVVRSWMADRPIVDDPAAPGRVRVFLSPGTG